jgi:hypothetical protein
MAVRPDMASVALATAATFVYVLTLAPSEAGRLRLPARAGAILASLLFFLAWSFKQSTIGMMGGIALHALLWKRDVRAFAALALPAGLLVATTLALGGGLYRLNTLTLPALSDYRFLRTAGYPQLVQILVAHPVLILMPVVAGAWWFRYGRRQLAGRDTDGTTDPMIALALAAGVASAWCLVAIGRDGSWKNTLLEGYIATMMAGAAWTVRSLTMRERTDGAAALVLAAWLATSGYPLAQLLFPDRIGRLTLATAEEYADSERLAEFVAGLPGPILVEEQMFAEPWHSTGGAYPATVLDGYYYLSARAAGLLRESGGVDALIASHRYPAMLLTNSLGFVRAAEAAGYRQQPLPFRAPWGYRLYTAKGVGLRQSGTNGARSTTPAPPS